MRTDCICVCFFFLHCLQISCPHSLCHRQAAGTLAQDCCGDEAAQTGRREQGWFKSSPLTYPLLPQAVGIHPLRSPCSHSHSPRAFGLLRGSSVLFCFIILYFIYLFLAVLGLHFCARAFSSCGRQGPLFIAVHGPLTIAASLVAEHRLQTRRLSNCDSRALLLRGMWDLPRPGLEPVSPALAGRLSTTAPPGKPPWVLSFMLVFHIHAFFFPPVVL